MNWINFLHFYQPANQQKDILEAVVKQSYLPIFKKINELDNLSLSINISGALLELFERDGYDELLGYIINAVKSGKVELTGSCKYHALIPLIPEDEIRRQILLNEQTLQNVLGLEDRPTGFFPPEMAYAPKLDAVLEDLGYKWMIVDEIAGYDGENYPDSRHFYQAKGTDIQVFFRNRRLSNLIMSAVARDIPTLERAMGDISEAPYFVTGMDGETFGHHRIGFENFLFKILEDSSLGVTGIKEFLKNSPELPVEEIELKPSTWASSIEDIEQGIQFLSWNDPDNPIHKVQWDFLNFVLDQTKASADFTALQENFRGPPSKDHSGPNDTPWKSAREKLDVALASDHFWWASAKPWWSLEMIEDGAYRLLDVIKSIPNVSEEVLFKAYRFYMDIVSRAAEWQREGIVRKMAQEQNKILRIPFKDRTIGKGGAEEGVYWAFIDMMKEQEKKSAEKGDYEQATLWRDAIYKLDKKHDIYDAINVIDMLRLEVGNGPVEETIEKYKDKYRKIRGGQPEQRGS